MTAAGLRRNNPGNLRDSAAPWLGKTGVEGGFVTFDTAAHGLRAAAINILSQYRHHGCNTVRKLISRWAPPIENATAAYVTAVSAALGVKPDAPLDFAAAGTLTALLGAIVRQENGSCPFGVSELAAAATTAIASERVVSKPDHVEGA